MTGASPLAPPLADMRVLLGASRRLGGPWGATLEIGILTLALPWEVAAVDLHRIDWDRSVVPVPARGGAERILALPDPAARAILRIAGTASGRGQAITAGRGRRLMAKSLRLDRLMDRLAAETAETIPLAAWNFHGIRAAGASLLSRHGASSAEIAAVLGTQVPGDHRRLRGDAGLALVGAERWCRILLPAASATRPG